MISSKSFFASAIVLSALLWTASSAPEVNARGALTESGFVGELEGAELVLGPAAAPSSLHEAPMLAEGVAAGDLPPVEERVPSEPLVIKPVQEVGQYGGTWRRGFLGQADGENGNRINASDKLLFWTTPARRSCRAPPRVGNKARAARRSRCSCARA